MAKKRPAQGSAKFYTRDSGGKHETTPARYVEWAATESAQRGLRFSGTPEMIEDMIRAGESHRGDIFLDYDVSGNQMSRPGLNALIAEATKDNSVSHILIPRRDRLARPDDALDGIRLENLLRRVQLTLVFRDKVLEPIPLGSRQDIADLILGVVEYDKAGQYRRQLAEQMLLVKLTLARAGYSTGGRAPYCFRRWLMKENGTLVRQLSDGEHVHFAGHHVVWLPVPQAHPDMAVVCRILDLIEVKPARQIAALLTSEGVPTPDAGRFRTDLGVRHLTSGVWHPNTVTNIARNPLLAAIATFGRRSMGDQLRYTPEGPRELTDSDLNDDGKPKVVRNVASDLIQAPAHFKPIIEPARHEHIQQILDKRGASQRGKPRSKDPSRNPLGARVFDMSCGWSMYRAPYSDRFRYVCGLYVQSNGQRCLHNHVDGPTATQFVLGCARQGALAPHVFPKLKARLEELAQREPGHPTKDAERRAKQAELAELDDQIARAGKNMLLAKDPEQLAAMSDAFSQLKRQKAAVEVSLAKLPPAISAPQLPEAEVAKALQLLEVLHGLAGDDHDYTRAGQVFGLLNARLFVAFKPEQVKKRKLNKLSGGVVTFGNAEPPVPIYEGPTARKRVKSEQAAAVAAGLGAHDNALPDGMVPDREGKSLGNVNRGDRI